MKETQVHLYKYHIKIQWIIWTIKMLKYYIYDMQK